MKIMITQSNYIPWKGFFDSLAVVDKYVVFDEMQYTRRDWRNRNKIKTKDGLKWLSIPVEVKGKFLQKINETQIADKNWAKSHLSAIQQNYKNAPFYNEVFPWVKDIYHECNFNYLTEVNVFFIKAICKFLEIEVDIMYSKDFELDPNKTQRLVNICKQLGGSAYYTGLAAKNYMEDDKFEKEGIEVIYWNYDNYKEYKQLFLPFEHGVTIFDLIFNAGKDSKNFLKFIK